MVKIRKLSFSLSSGFCDQTVNKEIVLVFKKQREELSLCASCISAKMILFDYCVYIDKFIYHVYIIRHYIIIITTALVTAGTSLRVICSLEEILQLEIMKKLNN